MQCVPSTAPWGFVRPRPGTNVLEEGSGIGPAPDRSPHPPHLPSPLEPGLPSGAAAKCRVCLAQRPRASPTGGQPPGEAPAGPHPTAELLGLVLAQRFRLSSWEGTGSRKRKGQGQTWTENCAQDLAGSAGGGQKAPRVGRGAIGGGLTAGQGAVPFL